MAINMLLSIACGSVSQSLGQALATGPQKYDQWLAVGAVWRCACVAHEFNYAALTVSGGVT
ncbi:hypothetical protein GCM10011297_09270 [Bacterioplanes sanyensis]|nr:hypothetical protein GCM10011297_09270 [Bacterioplanes sanyensis]